MPLTHPVDRTLVVAAAAVVVYEGYAVAVGDRLWLHPFHQEPVVSVLFAAVLGTGWVYVVLFVYSHVCLVELLVVWLVDSFVGFVVLFVYSSVCHVVVVVNVFVEGLNLSRVALSYSAEFFPSLLPPLLQRATPTFLINPLDKL